MTPRQTAFDLGATVRLQRADFFVSASNAQAMATVEAWADWPGGKLVLLGLPGAGKSHLAQLWATMARAVVVRGADLAGLDLSRLGHRVVVEDAGLVAGDEAAEAALFHLHNLTVPEGRLLITADAPPRDWGLRLADLVSRLQAAQHVRLDPPDDALLSAVLIKLFADRQIAVPPNLIAYLVPRIERSLGAAAAVVVRLDMAALALGRPVTRTLAAEILDIS